MNTYMPQPKGGQGIVHTAQHSKSRNLPGSPRSNIMVPISSVSRIGVFSFDRVTPVSIIMSLVLFAVINNPNQNHVAFKYTRNKSENALQKQIIQTQLKGTFGGVALSGERCSESFILKSVVNRFQNLTMTSAMIN